MAQNNGRPLNAAQAIQQFGHVPTIEQKMVQEAEDEIKKTLTKYGCMIVYEHVTHNGMPVGGTFMIRRRPGEAKEIAKAVPHPVEDDLNA